jgi:hypothetical protein
MPALAVRCAQPPAHALLSASLPCASLRAPGSRREETFFASHPEYRDVTGQCGEPSSQPAG